MCIRDRDQAEYLYEFAKSFGDCSYSSCKKNEAQKLKRTLLVRRQSFYNNQPKKYPWYLEIEVTKNEKKEKSKVKKQVPLRLSKELYDEIAQWAEDEFRSMNGQIEYLLTECVKWRKRSGKKDE